MRRALALVYLIVAGLLFWWFRSISSPGFKAVLLTLSVAFALRALLRLSLVMARWIPERHARLLVMAAAWMTGSVYYIVEGTSTVGVVIAWILLVLNGFVGLQRVVMVVADALPMHRLLQAAKSKTRPDLRIPLVYVHAEPGLGVFVGEKLTVKIMEALMELHGRKALWPLMSSSLPSSDREFTEWVAQHSAALVVVSVPGGDATPEFDAQTRALMTASLGEVILVQISAGGRQSPVEGLPRNVTVVTHVADKLQVTWEAASMVADRLVASALPMALSDGALPEELVRFQGDLARRGSPFLARPYLRFRLARSDSERFLCILDCFETIAKLSTVVLVADELQGGSSLSNRLIQDLRVPTLGQWVGVLYALAKQESHGSLARCVAAFWLAEIGAPARSVVADAANSGFDLPQPNPDNNVGWLTWLVNLRNVTRGHGSVDEARVAPLVHGLHATFLAIVGDLGTITINAELSSVEQDGTRSSSRGWCRGQVATSDGEFRPVMLSASGIGDGELALAPFILRRGDRLLVWNAIRVDQEKNERFEFLDYEMGELHHSSLDALNPIKHMRSRQRPQGPEDAPDQTAV